MNPTDKRSTHTDALDTLGTAPIPADAGRDAIHLAVEPVVAADTVYPGQKVGRYPDGTYGPITKPVLGIVDPFIGRAVAPGERFWLIVPPRQITSLRHVWSHPDFPEDAPQPAAPHDPKTASVVWIKDYMRDTLGLDPECKRDPAGYWDDDGHVTAYDFLMQRAREAAAAGEDYVHSGALDLHDEIDPEFWRHFAIVTGMDPTNLAPRHFTCSC